MDTIETGVNASLDETSDHGSSQAGRGKYTGSLAELALGVPRAEDIVGADKGGGLGDTLEEADGHDALGIMDGGGYHGQAGPDDHASGEEVSRLDVVQRQVRRDLANHVADGEARVDLVQLVPHEAEVLFHPGYVRIVEVGTVQLFNALTY